MEWRKLNDDVYYYVDADERINGELRRDAEGVWVADLMVGPKERFLNYQKARQWVETCWQ